MAKVEVEMWAFAKGAVRTVTIPDGEPVTLDRVFELGQNDFCAAADRALRLPSVSVGDVIRLDGKRFAVCSVGFREVGAEWRPSHDEYGRMECLTF